MIRRKLALSNRCIFCALIISSLLYLLAMIAINPENQIDKQLMSEPTKHKHKIADLEPTKKTNKIADLEPKDQLIDIVYMWVNGSDPVLLESIDQYVSKIGSNKIPAGSKVLQARQ